MGHVYSNTTKEQPEVAKGLIPIMEWDMWVDSGDTIVMVAECSQQAEPVEIADKFSWLQCKALEWFGGTVRLMKGRMERIDANHIRVSGCLASARI